MLPSPMLRSAVPTLVALTLLLQDVQPTKLYRSPLRFQVPSSDGDVNISVVEPLKIALVIDGAASPVGSAKYSFSGSTLVPVLLLRTTCNSVASLSSTGAVPVAEDPVTLSTLADAGTAKTAKTAPAKNKYLIVVSRMATVTAKCSGMR